MPGDRSPRSLVTAITTHSFDVIERTGDVINSGLRCPSCPSPALATGDRTPATQLLASSFAFLLFMFCIGGCVLCPGSCSIFLLQLEKLAQLSTLLLGDGAGSERCWQEWAVLRVERLRWRLRDLALSSALGEFQLNRRRRSLWKKLSGDCVCSERGSRPAAVSGVRGAAGV